MLGPAGGKTEKLLLCDSECRNFWSWNVQSKKSWHIWILKIQIQISYAKLLP